MKIRDLIEALEMMYPYGEVVNCLVKLSDEQSWEVKENMKEGSFIAPPMTTEVFEAFQARQLSMKGMAKNIEPIITFILEKIKKAAGEGEYKIIHPFDGYKPFPLIGIEHDVMYKLKILGFTTILHPNPDPGHPCSSAYWEVSWNQIQ